MNDKKLTPGEIVIVASGVILLIFSFFKWYGISFSFGGDSLSVGNNGWQAPDAFFSVIAILIGVAMAAFVIVTKLAGVKVPEKLGGSLGWGMLMLITGAAAAVFLILKWLMNTDYTKFGLYISILAGIGLAAGGFLVAKERNELGAMKKAGGSTPPPAPPAA